MGMMDGGTNFKDVCATCKGTADGGTMLRYIHDRNKKICSDCHQKLDDEEGREEFNKYVHVNTLHRNRLL